MLLDPVCGMTVERAHARHLAEHDGVVYAFCSIGCRTRFIQEPADVPVGDRVLADARLTADTPDPEDRMQFEGTVEIAAPRDKVWAFVIDPNQVGQCGPGVESIEVIDDTHFKATAKVGVGFISARFKVNMEFAELHAPDAARSRPTARRRAARSTRRARWACPTARRRDDDGLVGRRQHLGHAGQRRRAADRGHRQQDDRPDLHCMKAKLEGSAPA